MLAVLLRKHSPHVLSRTRPTMTNIPVRTLVVSHLHDAQAPMTPDELVRSVQANTMCSSATIRQAIRKAVAEGTIRERVDRHRSLKLVAVRKRS